MRLIILGAGGFGRCTYDIAYDLNRYDEIRFLDDNSDDPRVLDRCVNFVNYLGDDTEFVVAIGNNEVRKTWINSILSVGGTLATIIHPRAYVCKSARIMPGCLVFPGAIVGAESILKTGSIINFNAIVDHGNIIEGFSHLAPGAIVKAENIIKEFTKVDSGEVIEARSRKQ